MMQRDGQDSVVQAPATVSQAAGNARFPGGADTDEVSGLAIR